MKKERVLAALLGAGLVMPAFGGVSGNVARADAAEGDTAGVTTFACAKMDDTGASGDTDAQDTDASDDREIIDYGNGTYAVREGEQMLMFRADDWEDYYDELDSALVVSDGLGDIPLDENYFPDQFFCDYCKKFDIDNDWILAEYERVAVQKIDVGDVGGICDITGIEYFPNLQKLFCAGKSLTTVDLTANKNLQFVDLQQCGLTSVKIGNLPFLDRLWINMNNLTEIDVTQCYNLTELYVSNNRLSKLDVSPLITLKSLSIMSNTDMTELDITSNMCLQDLTVTATGLSKLNLSQNTCLVELDCRKTSITELELYHCPALILLMEVTTPEPSQYGYDKYYLSREDPKNTTGYYLSMEIDQCIKIIKEGSMFGDFIERMYVIALDRESEPEGKAFWLDKVTNEGFSGGRVAVGFLIEAPEFLNRNLTDEQFVEVLYKTFFDRSADEGGKAFWMGHLATDMTREQVVRGFIDSTEWCNLCAYYSVKSGATNAKAERPSAKALSFAYRLYKECLGREPDIVGLEFWALRLTNLESTGAEAAKGFFESQEFQNQDVNTYNYVARLYKTFMGRKGDQAGMDFWIDHLLTDMTREQVLKSFAESEEFTNICKQYGIERGSV